MSLRRVFTADGAPFFPLGGQVHNSSASRREDMAAAWRALELMQANTAEVPVSWEQVEPEEGRFDFSAVDWLLEDAAARGLRLVLLWFGTWKNGMMKYAPAWVKADTRRFRRVISAGGQPIAVLSSHCPATLEADRRAFAALMAHLRERDAAGTVIAVQVENEPGIIGSDRDYGPEAEAELRGPAPDGLVEVIAAAEGSAANAAWRASGARAGGSWLELFGEAAAGEQLTAYSIARFCDAVAEAGRRAHDIPLYANVWLGEMGWRTPGASYPSGGGTLSALDVWRWATPHLDLIAPDIYIQHRAGFGAICAGYARPDNPLFIPESMPGPSNALTMLSAIADYGAIGYAVFGIESLLSPDGEPHPERTILIDTYRAVAAVLPLVLAHQGTPAMRAIVQDEHQSWQYLDMGDYEAMALFASADTGFVWRDFRHPPGAAERGRGLLFRTGERELIACGGGYRLVIRRKQAPRALLTSPHVNDQFIAPRLANYVLVEEGRFDGGAWATGRRRNGDESDSGIWVAPDIGAVRVILGE
jgi:beta-galactosidase GanA